MGATRALERTRSELSEFLKSRRERITPQEVGLPAGTRRRTPGLRREEVAALAGVGLTWYTWLEQGREIRASSAFLDRLASTLKLDAAERRHLFLLAHQRLPVEPGKTRCDVPPILRNLMDDLPHRPAYLLNLRWDVLAWNNAADRLFEFSANPAQERNLLWLLFTDERVRALFDPWEAQVKQMLGSFKRDAANAFDDAPFQSLIALLKNVSPDFARWWPSQDIDGPCLGVRHLRLPGAGVIDVDHTSLITDADRHLRLVYYAPRGAAFRAWFEDV
ncbi:helix-turn-helix transcriptional regulator [Halomonas dongshanensis]|uniref:Helix-turn-helix transcriptional regulator n=1 Tax=Halomonas dongshanensis TaxID=2890835 RepID=A0ABT2EAF6_9GAMM|nr:helix-turn-helix transcriptional regulator [Halomonas dongshanensis]MCS2608563.1 helix-turn-helix transcriptional regulator [Halomonas dongshanensis]